jgi:hypothetical protein
MDHKVLSLPANTGPKQVERIHDAVSAKIQPMFRLQTALSKREILQRLEAQQDAGV